ncbi:hypothetical protein [Terasakiella pusilla]|uniref:hypothetical protein n=1 Tax=Terasakiella pusilla TaxID=64973 RepID=UPI003AA8727D
MVLSTTISLRMQAMMAHWAICPGLQILIDLLGDAIGLGFKEMKQALDNPEGYYLAKGGYIWFARSGGNIIGCCALAKRGEQRFEISKMARSVTLVVQ